MEMGNIQFQCLIQTKGVIGPILHPSSPSPQV